jgi:hypothetical protein
MRYRRARRNPKFQEGKWWPEKPTGFCSACKQLGYDKPGSKCYCGGTYLPLEIPDLQTILPLAPCECNVCKEFCTRPCFPTAAEAEAMIDAGYGDRLMGFTYYDVWNPIYMLIPAKAGYEQQDIHYGGEIYCSDMSRCTFVTDEGLCDIHGECKPIGGRMADHTTPYPGLEYSIIMTWDTPLGEKVREQWEEEYEHRNTRCVQGHYYTKIGNQRCPECYPSSKYRRNY